MEGSRIEIHYADDWAALYIDGKLKRVGDTYLAEEKAFDLLGVKIVQDDAFMRGQNQREGVAQNLNEVSDYRIEREAAIERAKALREEAKRLTAEAQEIDPIKGGMARDYRQATVTRTT